MKWYPISLVGLQGSNSLQRAKQPVGGMSWVPEHPSCKSYRVSSSRLSLVQSIVRKYASKREPRIVARLMLRMRIWPMRALPMLKIKRANCDTSIAAARAQKELVWAMASLTQKLRTANERRLDLSSQLSRPLHRLVNCHADALGVPEEFILYPLITSVAACIGVNGHIRINPTWVEPSILWLIVAAKKRRKENSRLLSHSETTWAIARGNH